MIHYIAPHAAVAIAGPASLDDLEAVVVAAFDGMPKQAAAAADEVGDGDSASTSTGAPRQLQPYLFADGVHSAGLQVILLAVGMYVYQFYIAMQDGSLWRLPLWVLAHSLEQGCCAQDSTSFTFRSKKKMTIRPFYSRLQIFAAINLHFAAAWASTGGCQHM